MLTCASYGSALSSLTAKGRYSYFYCLGRFSRRTDCREPFVAQEQLERIVEQVYGGLKLSERQENQLRTALERELTDEVSFSVEKAAMARRRLAHAQHEREKLLQAYFADALPLEVFKREQTRIAKEIDSAQAEIAEAESTDSPYREMLETALSYMRRCPAGLCARGSLCERLWNRTLIERITIKHSCQESS